MRILLSPSRYLPALGGIEEVTRTLALGLIKRGHVVEVWTHRHDVNLNTDDIHDGVRVRRFEWPLPSSRPWTWGRFLVEASRQCSEARFAWRQFRPDVVGIQGVSANAAYLLPLSIWSHVPLVVTTHGETFMDAESVYQDSLFLRLLFRATMRGARTVTAPSRYILKRASEIGDVPDGALVLPNGVGTSAVTDVPDHGIRESTSGPYFLVAARLVENKGIAELIRAFGMVQPHWPGLCLVVCGDGPLEVPLRKLAEDLGLASSVVLLGRIERTVLRRLMETATAVVVPSPFEPFGMTALEALASGTPVIGVNQGGLPEFAAPAAILCSSNAPDELATAMKRMRNRQLRDRLSVAARGQARLYSDEVMVNLFAKVYGEV